MAIHFYDSNGADISEDAQRKIERLFQREDYRRALPEEMGDISFPHRAVEDYTVELAQIVEPGRIAERRFKLVIDYGYGAAVAGHGERADQAAGRRAGRQPLRLDRRPALLRPGGVDADGWRTWCGPRARSWARCSTPTASA